MLRRQDDGKFERGAAIREKSAVILNLDLHLPISVKHYTSDNLAKQHRRTSFALLYSVAYEKLKPGSSGAKGWSGVDGRRWSPSLRQPLKFGGAESIESIANLLTASIR